MKINTFAYLVSLGILMINTPIVQKSTQNNLKKDMFFEINYEDLLKQRKIASLSQIATKVEYIQLETDEKCMIYNNAKYFFSDNYIFVKNKNHILKFSSDGKFIKQIGTPGRGPGEITSIWTTSIISEKKLIVVYDPVAHKLRYFDFDGNIIKTIRIPEFDGVKVLNDYSYIAYSQAPAGSEKYTHLLIGKLGDTLSVVKNIDSWETQYPDLLGGVSSPSFEPFYTYRNKYYLKSMYNDTVYVINSNLIRASYFIDLGKYRLPEEKRFERLSPGERQSYNKNSQGYYFTYVFEAGDRLFLTADEWGGSNKIDRYLINKSGFIANTDIKYSGVYRGYIDNDWDGGTPFWPKGSVNDNKVFMPIYVADLKNILGFRRSSTSLKALVKFPDKRTQLEKMASELDISDNPILMVVTLKSVL